MALDIHRKHNLALDNINSIVKDINFKIEKNKSAINSTKTTAYAYIDKKVKEFHSKLNEIIENYDKGLSADKIDNKISKLDSNISSFQKTLFNKYHKVLSKSEFNEIVGQLTSLLYNVSNYVYSNKSINYDKDRNELLDFLKSSALDSIHWRPAKVKKDESNLEYYLKSIGNSFVPDNIRNHKFSVEDFFSSGLKNSPLYQSTKNTLNKLLGKTTTPYDTYEKNYNEFESNIASSKISNISKLSSGNGKRSIKRIGSGGGGVDNNTIDLIAENTSEIKKILKETLEFNKKVFRIEESDRRDQQELNSENLSALNKLSNSSKINESLSNGKVSNAEKSEESSGGGFFKNLIDRSTDLYIGSKIGKTVLKGSKSVLKTGGKVLKSSSGAFKAVGKGLFRGLTKTKLGKIALGATALGAGINYATSDDNENNIEEEGELENNNSSLKAGVTTGIAVGTTYGLAKTFPKINEKIGKTAIGKVGQKTIGKGLAKAGLKAGSKKLPFGLGVLASLGLGATDIYASYKNLRKEGKGILSSLGGATYANAGRIGKDLALSGLATIPIIGTAGAIALDVGMEASGATDYLFGDKEKLAKKGSNFFEPEKEIKSKIPSAKPEAKLRKQPKENIVASKIIKEDKKIFTEQSRIITNYDKSVIIFHYSFVKNENEILPKLSDKLPNNLQNILRNNPESVDIRSRITDLGNGLTKYDYELVFSIEKTSEGRKILDSTKSGSTISATFENPKSSINLQPSSSTGALNIQQSSSTGTGIVSKPQSSFSGIQSSSISSPITSTPKISTGNVSYDDLYNAIQSAETGGLKNGFIRTKYGGQTNGQYSSAYGPLQITYSTAQSVLKDIEKSGDQGLINYAHSFINQGKDFIHYSQGKGGLGSEFAPGGTGILSSADNEKYYPELAKYVIKSKWNASGGDINKFTKLWTGYNMPASHYQGWLNRFNKSLGSTTNNTNDLLLASNTLQDNNNLFTKASYIPPAQPQIQTAKIIPNKVNVNNDTDGSIWGNIKNFSKNAYNFVKNNGGSEIASNFIHGRNQSGYAGLANLGLNAIGLGNSDISNMATNFIYGNKQAGFANLANMGLGALGLGNSDVSNIATNFIYGNNRAGYTGLTNLGLNAIDSGISSLINNVSTPSSELNSSYLSTAMDSNTNISSSGEEVNTGSIIPTSATSGGIATPSGDMGGSNMGGASGPVRSNDPALFSQMNSDFCGAFA